MTVTVLVTTFQVFPATSVYVYSRVYGPIRAVLTDQLVAVTMVLVPSTLSIQKAPGSMNTLP